MENGSAEDGPQSPAFDRDKPWYYEGQGSRTFKLWVEQGFAQNDFDGKENWWQVYTKYKQQLRPKYGEQRYLLRWNAEWMVFTHFCQDVTLEEFGAREPEPIPVWRIRQLEGRNDGRIGEELSSSQNMVLNARLPKSKKGDRHPKEVKAEQLEGGFGVKATGANPLRSGQAENSLVGAKPSSAWQQMIADAERESHQHEQHNVNEIIQKAIEPLTPYRKTANGPTRSQTPSRPQSPTERREEHSEDSPRVITLRSKAKIKLHAFASRDTGVPGGWTSAYAKKMGFVFFPDVRPGVREEMTSLYGIEKLRGRDQLRKMADIERLKWIDEKRRQGFSVGSPLFDELEPEAQPLPLGTHLLTRVDIYRSYKEKHDKRSQVRKKEEATRQKSPSREIRRKRRRSDYQASVDRYTPRQRQRRSEPNRDSPHLESSSSHILPSRKNQSGQNSERPSPPRVGMSLEVEAEKRLYGRRISNHQGRGMSDDPFYSDPPRGRGNGPELLLEVKYPHTTPATQQLPPRKISSRPGAEGAFRDCYTKHPIPSSSPEEGELTPTDH